VEEYIPFTCSNLLIILIMQRAELLREIQTLYGDDTAQLLKDLTSQQPTKVHSPKKVEGPVLVSIDKVTKTYKLGKTTVEALSGVSLEVKQGEIVALTGPSGSGKSTLLHLIAGLDHPTTGNVTVADTRVNTLRGDAMARYRAEKLGFVFQFFYLQPFLSLKTNVKVPTMFVDMSEAERENRATSLIKAVDLSDRADHLPAELSGGQMQRAAIARALMNQPKLILADEPTGNLDSTNAAAIMELFEKIRTERGTTIIVVTHDHRVAGLADRIIELKDGRLL
jgi:ABC-type lipoprotein export system ATPase subunit